MSTVDVEYCVPCGHRERALSTADDLLEAVGQDVEFVSLTPGDGGVFRISVDGETVYDAQESGYDAGAIREAVAERVQG